MPEEPIVSALVSISLLPLCFAAEAPKLIQKDGRCALMVDGHLYLILGGQIHNSSAWPVELPQVWDSMAALHAKTSRTGNYSKARRALSQSYAGNASLTCVTRSMSSERPGKR